MNSKSEELRRRLESVPKNRAGRRRYSAELKAEVIEHAKARVAEGVSESLVAAELGLTQRTLWGWIKKTTKRRVRRVRVVEDQRRSKIVVVLGCGVRIEGMGHDDVVKLVKALS
jgi:transposase-like protein